MNSSSELADLGKKIAVLSDALKALVEGTATQARSPGDHVFAVEY